METLSNADVLRLYGEREVLARTIWGEARGEGRRGMQAVANVIMNRFRRPRWWSRNKGDGIPDDTVAAVCFDPWQFSCWNMDDPNRKKMIEVSVYNAEFRLAYQIAGEALENNLPDLTGGADHYHTISISPKWAKGATPTAFVEKHVFYRLEA